jgi:hypothetical protein
MAVRKVKRQTFHGVSRIKERTDIAHTTEAKKLIKNASQYGLPVHRFRNSKLLYAYLKRRIHGNKRVVLYAGYVFIFMGGSNRLITMYPLPDFYKGEYYLYAK